MCMLFFLPPVNYWKENSQSSQLESLLGKEFHGTTAPVGQKPSSFLSKDGLVKQKPPVSHPGAKFQSLASTCIQEHVPAIQNPPTPAATPVGKKILKRALPGRAGNCSRFKMEIFEIWKEGKLLSPIIATWRDFSTWGILEYKSWKFILLYLCFGQDLFFAIPYATM